MKPTFFRIVFFLFLSVVQVSFSNILFASLSFPPPIVLGAVVSLSLLKGFSFSWRWAVFGGILFDSMLFSRIGVSSFEFVLASAVFGMLAREFFVGYRMGRAIFFGIGMWFFEFLWRIIFMFQSSVHSESFFSTVFGENFSRGLFGSFLVSVLVFFILFRLTSFFERFLEIFDRFRPHR